MKNSSLYHWAIAMLTCSLPLGASAGTPPKVGDKAPDFALKTLADQTIRLSDLTTSGNVVLIVLRGWPGYQCPFCTLQAHDYLTSAAGFAEAKAHVVMVYPGPAEALKAHAKQFLGDKQWPKNFVFVTDPDYSMVNSYGLRWNAPKETAYPSTFVLDRKGLVRFEQISHSHGDRTKASDILKKLNQVPND